MAQKYKQDSKKQEIKQESTSIRQCTHPKRVLRQKSAKKCAEARAKRTDVEQLNHLDKMLGKNKGAKKERLRLKDRIRKSKEGKRKNK